MKTVNSLLLLVLLLATNAYTQVATYTPKSNNFKNTITITINLNLANGATLSGILNTAAPLYLWAGAGTSTANSFEYTPKSQTNFNAAYNPGLLKSVGINKYQITFNPQTYFEVPTNKTIVIIGMLVKNETGTAQSADFTITLNTAKQDDVVVTSKKPFIENLIDKTVLNVQSDLNSIGSTAFEILQKAPGVTITGEDVIKMAGKGSVNILIDGRPTQMGEKDLANYLKSTPGSNIDKIEIISNPSSKYDAQGTAGIINIKFKRSKNLGTNGNISSDYTQSVHNRYGAGLNLNNRNKIANVYGNFGYRASRQNTFGGVDRTISGTNIKYFENKTVDKDKFKGGNYRLGTDFIINKKSTIGFLTDGNIAIGQLLSPGATLIKNSFKIVDSSIITDNVFKNNATNSANNLNYTYEDTLGRQLILNADYVFFDNKIDANTNTKLVNVNNAIYGNQLNILNTRTKINIYGFKADYIKPLKKQKAKFEAGLKTNTVITTNNLAAQKLAYGVISKDTTRTNNFKYNENVNAAYATFSQEVNKKISYQIGFRVEQTNIKGVSTDIFNTKINKPDTAYLNIFPTTFLKYVLNKNSQLIASFSRRLNRPNYQAMNPFENLIDIYTAEKGNPFLKPEYSNNYEIKYIFKDAISLGAGYNQTKDFLQGIVSQEGEKTFATQKNLGKKQSLYFQFNVPMPITKKWFLYTSFTAYNNRYIGTIPEGSFNVAAWGFNGYMDNSITLPKNYKLQFGGWWQIPGLEGIGRIKPFGSFDVGMSKTVWRKKLQIRAGIRDIFNTQRYQEGAILNTINYSYYRKWESRGVAVSLSYKFGNTNVKESRERNTLEDANRIMKKN